MKHSPVSILKRTITAIPLLSMCTQVQAQTIGTVSQNLSFQISDVQSLVFSGSAVLGLLLVCSGLLKFKQAADSQGQQAKYGDGIWRLAVGAGLVALPALIPVLTTTFGLSTDTFMASLAR